MPRAEPEIVPLAVEGLPAEARPRATYALKAVVGGPVTTYTTDPVRGQLPPPVGQRSPPPQPQIGGFVLEVTLGTLEPADDRSEHVEPFRRESAPNALRNTLEGASRRAWNVTWVVPATAGNSDGGDTGDNRSRADFPARVRVAPPVPQRSATKDAEGPAMAAIVTVGLAVVAGRRRSGR